MELVKKQSQLNAQSQVDPVHVAADSISLTNFDVYKDGGFFYVIFKVSMKKSSEENQPLGAVDVAVHLQLCLASEVKGLPVWLNSRDQKMYVTEQDRRVQICFIEMKDGVEKRHTHTLDVMSLEALRNKLAAYIAYTLSDTVVELSNPSHCFAWVAINCIDGEKSEIVYHENLGKNDDFVTSSLANSQNNTLSTNDTGTIVNRDGKFAATVVDGGTENLIGRCVPLLELPVYSALVTTAAMHVVEHGILVCGLQRENLHALFLVTVKLLLNAHNIKIEPAQWPQFKGLVLFKEDGVPSQFSYSSNGIASVTALPDDGSPIEPQVLTATNIRDRAVLRVSIDVYKFFVSKDDFELFLIPKNSGRYLNTESTYQSRLASAKNARSQLIRNKSAYSYRGFNYLEKEANLEIEKIEEEMRKPEVIKAEQQRILKNKTVGILINPSLIEFAEEYGCGGGRDLPDIKFFQAENLVDSWEKSKIALVKKQNEVAKLQQLRPKKSEEEAEIELQKELALPHKLELLKRLSQPKRAASFDQIKLSEKTKLVNSVNAEKEELSRKLREPNQFDFLGKVELSKKMWVSGPLSSSEKFNLSKKLWSSEPLQEQEIEIVLNKVRLSEKSDQVEKLEKLELPQTNLELKQKELRALKNNFNARKKEVYEMVMQRELVANKLERNLKQAETDLKKKQEELAQLKIDLGIKQKEMTQPEQLQRIKTELEIKKKEVGLLKIEIVRQQQEVTDIAEQQEVIDKKLKQQQAIDDILAQRYSERIQKGLDREGLMFKRKKEAIRAEIQVELEARASKFDVL